MIKLGIRVFLSQIHLGCSDRHLLATAYIINDLPYFKTIEKLFNLSLYGETIYTL